MNKEFIYSDLFKVLPQSFKVSKLDFVSDGKTPAYSSDTRNNGRVGLVDREPLFQITEDTPVYLIFGDHTRTMNIVHEDFCVMDNVKVLVPLIDMSDEVLLYITICWKKAIPNLGYARHWSVAKTAKFELPIIESDDPNYVYTVEDIDFGCMQKRIAELEQERIAELDAYLVAADLDDYELTDEDKKILSLFPKSASDEAGASEADCGDGQVRFKKFTLGALFTSFTGDVDLQQKDINGKGQFFINSGVENCGIKGKTDKPAKVFPANTITVDFWGNAYYRDFNDKLATHNHVFSLSGDVIKNRLVGLYIVGMLSKLPGLFSYDNMATWNKLKSLEIKLPVTSAGNIDFDYMERYIRALEKLTIADAVKYKDKVIVTTKRALGV